MRYRLVALVFFIASVTVCGFGLMSFRSNMEDVFQWLPDDSHERAVYDEFVDRFGVDDFVVVSWASCDLSDRRADTFAEALRLAKNRQHVRDVVSGRELIVALNAAAKLAPQTVIERFRGIYFGLESAHTCVVVSLTEHGMENRKAAIASIESVAGEVLGDGDDQLVIGGYPQVGAYGDQIIRSSMIWLVGPSCIVSTLIAWICLRSIRITIAILVVSGLAAGLSIAFVTLSGAQWGGLSSVIPTLAYIMTVSGALHLCNYGRDLPRLHLARQVLSIGWKPCVFSALTTAAGMLSLCRSDFPAVREFGIYCAVGVVGAVVCQLILIPVALELLHRHLRPSPQRFWQDHILRFVLRYDWWIAGAFFIVVCVFGSGLTSLRADLEVERNFRADSPVMKNIQWLEQTLGPLEQTELVVSFPVSQSVGFVERMQVVAAVQESIRNAPSVRSAVSLVDSLPVEPTGGGLRQSAARAAYRRGLESAREQLAESPYLFVGPSEEAWRISIRVPFFAHTDFAKLEKEVRRASARALGNADVTVRYTGVSHLYHVAQGAVMADLYWNFGLAFALILPFMMFAVRSFFLGAMAMIPNVAPAIFVFGGMGLLNYPIDIGVAMTASVALGIAVDDTTHFLMRFRELGRGDRSSLTALQLAYRQCSTAMFQTTLIAGLGLCVFIGGPLAAMSRFAIVLMALLSVALLCDLTLLPSLLKSCRFVRSDREPR